MSKTPEMPYTAPANMLQFDHILRQSPIGMAIIAFDGTYEAVNTEYCNIYGYTESDLIGQNVMKVFPVGRQKWVLGLHQKFLIEGGTLGGEWEVIRRDGRLLHVWSESAAVMGADGIKKRLVYVKDISERKQLELTAKHFESIVHSSDDAIISKTIDGIITSWNRGAQYMFGYTASEMIGQSMLTLLPDDVKYEEDIIISKLISGERIQHFETVRQHKDGHRVHVSVTVSPIRDEKGLIIGASKIARDITERKLLESRLALTSNVFTHTNEGIVVSDANGVVIEVNPAFSRITGYQREDVIGQKPLMFLSERQDVDLLSKIAMSLQSGNYYQGEVWSKKKDGIHFAVLLNINTVREAKGTTINYIAIFSDITLLQMKQEQIEHIAHFDALTDLPNRSLLADRLQQAMMVARRQQQKLAVLYLDLDGFKAINDTYGHAAGDALLVMVSGRMKAAMRDSDTLARMGGDEFVAVLQNVNTLQDCYPLVQRILDACSQEMLIQGHAMQVSVSIGMTLYPEDDVDADQLIRHADHAMYQAKQSGKNRLHVFDVLT